LDVGTANAIPAFARKYATSCQTCHTVFPQYFLDLVPCRTACPVHTNAGGYVRAVAEGDTARGYAIARAPNQLASICGRICAHPCETACRRGTIDQPISIRALKRTLTERHGVERTIGAALTPPTRMHLAVG
jgi:NADPH-dependent glutamate synthase beta subunit-like oxidoreductase